MFSQKKPYSAVTVTIENLTGEAYEEDDLSGIPDLVEVIKLQTSGPTEAARAIRKKLKYGSVHRQLRALTLLDGLIQNAGPRFQRSFVDEMLLERLRVCGTSDLSDPDVRKKCSELFRGWAAEYKSTPGMERLARLYKELPQRKQVVTQAQSRVVRETENPFDDDEDEADTAATAAAARPGQASSSRGFVPQTQTQPTGRIESFSSFGRDKDRDSSKASKSKDKDKDKRSSTSGGGKSKKSRKPFNLETEKPVMKATIADASMATTDLTNTLQTINRELERISENEAAIERFEKCKLLRRKILRYIYLVNSEEYLGSLLHANDELVTALMLFEQLDRSIDADSDSDDDLAEQAHRYRMIQEQAAKDKDPNSPTSPTSSSSAVPDIASLNLGDATSGRSSKRNSGIASPPAAAPLSPLPQQARAAAPRPPAPPRPSPMSKPALGGRPPVPTAAMVAAAAARNRPAAGGAGDDSDGDSYVDDDDENDPFADSNAVGTPKVEKGEPRW